jgi:formylglycine-generating enzyme required for sulfatase activity
MRNAARRCRRIAHTCRSLAALSLLAALAALMPVVAAGTDPLTRARESALRPGDTFRECSTCPLMVVVPAGSFTMGSPEGEEGRVESESPQHAVTFARQFAVARFAATFDEWDACAAAGGCRRYRPSDEGWGRGLRPVINVSWDDARSYVAWLSRRTGKRYRLLTDAEREYVARAGTTTPFWWGASISTAQANYQGTETYAGGSQGEDRGRTIAVDSLMPNPWGLYQVHGNVGEWVEDCWHGNYAGAPTDGSAWLSKNCDFRVNRGGGWNNGPESLRAAVRNADSADYRASSLGFRVARTLAP